MGPKKHERELIKMAYRGLAKKVLEKESIKIGDRIRVERDDISYEGMLLDRPEDADDKHLVLKLDNGYNIGVEIEEATIELLEEGSRPKIKFPPVDVERNPQLPDISIISTGGTVASIIDYQTGAVHPAFTADDLLRANPELLDIANIRGKAIFNILSENMLPEYWVEAAHAIAKEIEDGAWGVVVAHGTDTMHYTAAALSFILKTPVPVILTGAQRSSDRPSSDAHLNLISSVVAAKSDIAEVMVCMHASIDDKSCHLHRGTKVRKMHTSRRDTFKSINTTPIAEIKDNKIRILRKDYKKRGLEELRVRDKIEPRVALIKTYPGINPEIIEYYIDKNYKGIVIEGTGLGHCPENLIPAIERANEMEIIVAMASQCINGRVNMNVYSTGRRLLRAGVIPVADMLPETAYVKLVWALGQSNDPETVKRLMLKNIAGEIEDRSSLRHFQG